jgi:DNA mismatch repair protein MLH1
VVMALIADVMDIMLKHAFVGIADLDMGLSLIQHSTRLFLANHISLA